MNVRRLPLASSASVRYSNGALPMPPPIMTTSLFSMSRSKPRPRGPSRLTVSPSSMAASASVPSPTTANISESTPSLHWLMLMARRRNGVGPRLVSTMTNCPGTASAQSAGASKSKRHSFSASFVLRRIFTSCNSILTSSFRRSHRFSAQRDLRAAPCLASRAALRRYMGSFYPCCKIPVG